jgi:hypothetical protein
MKKIVLITLLFLSTVCLASAQNIWIQKANVGAMNRENAVGFAIGTKGYIGLGQHCETQTLLVDFWEYDPMTNAWTQVADFGGTARFAASSFVVDSFAYVGLGSDSYPVYNFRKDFWKYSQSTNTWTQVAVFPGVERYNASTFVIGANGYVSTGWNQIIFFVDLWQYNSTLNSWSQKTNFPGNPRCAGVGFAIGNYGYIGTGDDNSSTYKDFYKYDPSDSAWTQIADLPSYLCNAAAFVLNNKAYVGTGSTTFPSINIINHFWEYSPLSNTWDSIADMSPISRIKPVAFAIGDIGYAGTGAYNSNISNDTVDFWEYSPLDVGIDKSSSKLRELSIYPNPSKGQMNINFAYSNNSLMLVEVLDCNGKVVYNKIQRKATGISNYNLDLSNLSNGIYFLKLTFDKDIEYRKFVLE